ncbi:protein kinase [Planotetraspora sp. A-T 1434]|uniref:serine/threonine-protein kinase n=1 Tax=Planotetraspora sp. A-T 1434 TaxID=2979219 RepID=UPI0021C1AAF6|nr:serine/threonine protein kinase [Planotetraspora sp. A-T 1434]MCT9931358.1 protein kinase [Planotetraspora sp. A-T 1434]
MNQDDRLGPYRLLRRLGEGGMGVVHLALDPHGRQVAVKVLRSEVTGDDVARRRLSREVETMRRVRSPHIAEVVDADVTGQRPYIVTRYVPGRPLDEIIKQDGPFSVDALLKVANGVAQALAAVHAAGVIHRDLKPGNVLMLDGQPVLIDFGIAQAVDATRLTQTGMFIGTPGYLAPEIIEGHEAGPEVDVHAWAGTLLFAATGQPPFGKGTLEMIFFAITSGKANVDAAPALLQPVLRAAFHRDPARRPTAGELVQRIGELMPQGRRPRVPDEITTVPNVDETTGQPVVPDVGPFGPRSSGSSPLPAYGGAPQGAATTPPVLPMTTPPVAPVAPPPLVQSPPGEEFVSLLKDAPAGGRPADPYPTVRVTGEDLRKAGLTGGAAEGDIPTWFPGQGAQQAPQQQPQQGPQQGLAEGDIPTRMAPPKPVVQPPSAWETPQRRLPEGDVPTRRVTSEELRQSVAQNQAFFEQAPEIYERTPQVHQPHPPTPFLPTVRVPPPTVSSSAPPTLPPGMPAGASPSTVPPSQLPAGALLQRSKAYGVASALLLVAMTGLAVIAPLPVCVLALPLAVLLRAADIAQPQLNARRPAGAAATDVIRVLSQPAALVKSIGVTLALVPYALVLGLPVALLLTVLVASMPVLAALSWGIAVALWTVCAGPGVEGPSRQMRRTLASLVPSGGAAAGLAWGIGAVATVVAAIAVASVMGKQTAGHFWGSIDVLDIVQRLTDLRNRAGNQ